MWLVVRRTFTTSTTSRIIPRSRIFANSSQRGRLRRDPPVRRPSESASASLDAWDEAVDIIKRSRNGHVTPFTGGLRIALLIDAENITYKNVDGIINEVEKLGIVQIRRIYADWTSEIMRGWRQTVLTNALTPVHQFQSSSGKGNTDSMMIIDAMDIMHKNKDIESFCIVSSDSDFTRLATKLREEGKLVLGIGSNLTPAPFVVACNRFVYLHNLMKEEPALSTSMPVKPSSSAPPATMTKSTGLMKSAPAAPGSSLPVPTGSTSTLPAIQSSAPAIRTKAKIDLTNWDSKPSVGATQARHGVDAFKGVLPLLTRAWAAYRLDNGWAPLAGVVNELQRIQPEFDPSRYGPFGKLEDMLEATDVFEIRKSKGSASTALVRRIMSPRPLPPAKPMQSGGSASAE